MDMLSLIPIVLLLILGGTALVLGRRGINFKTLVGAWLVLIFSVVFIVIAGLVADWEQAWRAEIRRFQDEIAKTTAGTGAADSLTDLDASAKRKRRELAEVETWRNRYWVSDFFSPPDIEPTADDRGLFEVTKKGTVELKAAGGGDPPLNIGAELAIFLQDAEPEFAFLGVFAVDQVEQQADGKLLTVSISPLVTPDDRDRKAWENWKLMLRAAAKPPQLLVLEDLPTDRWVAGGSEEESDEGEKVTLEDALAELDSGKGFPGEYWAKVTVENDAAFEDLDEGQTVELDLRTAQRLAADGGVTIDEVVRRRRLIDPLTALRGGKESDPDQPAATTAAGIEGVRRTLGLELASLKLMKDRISGALDDTKREAQRHQMLAASLTEDRNAWKEDIAFAEGALERLVERREKTEAELEATRQAIAGYRRELTSLTAEIIAKIGR